MSLNTTSELIDAAVRRQGAVAAFNVITLEHAEAVIAAAEGVTVPVILQISENAVRFHSGAVRPITRAAASIAESAAVPVALHLDHVTDFGLLRQAFDAGFSSAMFDAAALCFGDNLKVTRDAAEWAHSLGLWLEAELGYVGGKPEAPTNAHTAGVRTDPDEAVEYVAATGVDALAVAVGSSHAMQSRTACLDIELIRKLATKVTVPLVLHGSSGVPDDQLRAAVAAGIRKVNIGTALNVAYTSAIRDRISVDPNVVDPRKYLTEARVAMTATASQLLAVLAGDLSRVPSERDA